MKAIFAEWGKPYARAGFEAAPVEATSGKSRRVDLDFEWSTDFATPSRSFAVNLVKRGVAAGNCLPVVHRNLVAAWASFRS
jgi:hypothetical protein